MMIETMPEGLQVLHAFLNREDAGEEALDLSGVDGLLAGVLLSPEMIPPSEWMEEIWGGEEPAFADQDEAETVIKALMDHYNDMITQLDQGTYSPVLFAEAPDAMPVWEAWVEGFALGMALRYESWDVYADSGEEEEAFAFFTLSRLLFLVYGDEEDLEDEDDLEDATDPDDDMPSAEDLAEFDGQLLLNAPEAIMTSVQCLYDARPAGPRAGGHAGARAGGNGSVVRMAPKVGRNDPCPCGSGKKYKKCCMM